MTMLVVDCKSDSLQRIVTRQREIITELESREQVVIEQVRYVPKYYKFTSWVFWIIVAILLLLATFKICDKIPATKVYTTAIKAFFKL